LKNSLAAKGETKMKKQTKSNLLKSLQSLGIIFAIFFALAFACGDEGLIWE